MRVYEPNKTKRSGKHLVIDPCPACGIAQAAHWRCLRCTSRGHILGHTDPRSVYCDDCRAELARQSQKEAA